MLSLFLTHLEGYKKDAIKSPILITLEVICELILPLVMAEIVDVAIPAGDVGYIFLMGGLMLLLSLFAMACGVGKTPEERYEKAADFVRLVGLQDFADLTPAELSTGMKQRLGLARVLASQAQLLLMDEPFASLDFLTRGELQSQLLAIQKKLPRTIVLVTHQLEEALLLGQKIVVMHPDSTIREFDLSALPYPRDVEQPALRALKAEITDECRKPTASE